MKNPAESVHAFGGICFCIGRSKKLARPKCWRSVQTDDLPPAHTNGKRDEHARRHQDEVDLIETRTFEVALTEVDRTRAAGVFRDAPQSPAREPANSFVGVNRRIAKAILKSLRFRIDHCIINYHYKTTKNAACQTDTFTNRGWFIKTSFM